MMTDEERTAAFKARFAGQDLPDWAWPLLNREQNRDGVVRLVARLNVDVPAAVVANDVAAQAIWQGCGVVLLVDGRAPEAIYVFQSLYGAMVAGERARGAWVHKAMPLVWLHDCYARMGLSHIARRYLMLTLIEDAKIDLQAGSALNRNAGVYFRAVWSGWLSEKEADDYARKAYSVAQRLETEPAKDGWFPERILQELDLGWFRNFPTPDETLTWSVSASYVEHLLGRMGDRGGKYLELCAAYLLSVIPGCRVRYRQRSRVSDYDVVCTQEGPLQDFRTEIGRLFVAECKDWAKKANFTVIAKFARVLDSIGARFGILFSREGLTGAGTRQHAWLEQVKIYQQRGIAIVVVSKADIRRVADGENFVSLLREKYEEVRLNL